MGRHLFEDKTTAAKQTPKKFKKYKKPPQKKQKAENHEMIYLFFRRIRAGFTRINITNATWSLAGISLAGKSRRPTARCASARHGGVRGDCHCSMAYNAADVASNRMPC
jgi:hypothetical protein